MRRCTSRHAGFIAADVAVGLLLVGVLAAAFTAAVVQQHRASAQLAENRGRTALAERILTDLQAQRTPALASDDVQVEIRPIDSAASVNGHTWVQVTIRSQGRATSLTGLVPAGALKDRAAAATRPAGRVP